MVWIPILVATLNPGQEGVRDWFSKGGSIGSAFGVLGVLVVILVLGWIVASRQERVEKHAVQRNPSKLFATLLVRLGMAPVQRHLVERLATDLQLENPSVLLISPALFDHHSARWQSASEKTGNPAGSTEATLQAIRAHLFPATQSD